MVMVVLYFNVILILCVLPCNGTIWSTLMATSMSDIAGLSPFVFL